MPRLLNPQHEAFCRAFVRGPHAGNLCDAYEAAGYARDRGNACRLARQPDVVARVNALREGEAAAERAAVRAALAARAIDKARIVEELATIAFANPLDFFSTDADGNVRADIKRIERANGGAIRDLAVECVAAPDGKATVTKLRLRLNDKKHALTELARQVELAQEPPLPVETAAPPQPASEDAHREALIAQLRDLAEHDEDVVALATAAAEIAYPPNVPWGQATPARRARLRKDTGVTAARLQEALSEREVVAERHCEEAGPSRNDSGGDAAGSTPSDDAAAPDASSNAGENNGLAPFKQDAAFMMAVLGPQ